MDGEFGKYDATQVITETELAGLYNGFVLQLELLPWWAFRDRFKVKVLMVFTHMLLHWVATGKRSLKMDLTGEQNELGD